MAALPAIPPGFALESRPTGDRDPWDILREAGWTATNGYRTAADTARIRAQGYTPAEHSRHLEGDAVDLNHPGMSHAQQVAWLNEHFGDWPGFRVRDEGHHRHLQLPGWGAAPGTPGTPNSGLPGIPDGFTLEQRGSLADGNFVTAASPEQPVAPEPSRFPYPAPDFDEQPGLSNGATTPAPMVGAMPMQAPGVWGADAPAALPQWSPQADPSYLHALANRPQGPQGGPGTVEELPDDPRGHFASNSTDPRFEREGLAALQRAFESGADRDQLLGIAARYGQVPGSPGWANFNSDLNNAIAARSHGREGRFVPGDYRQVRPIEPDEEITVTGTPLPRPRQGTAADVIPQLPGARLTAHHPDIAERLGQAWGRGTQAVSGGSDFDAAQRGNRMESMLSDLTPVGAVDWAREADQRQQRALLEGRFTDATGDEIEAGFAGLTAIPIVGRTSRAARPLAQQTLRAIEELAGGAQLVDADLAQMATHRFSALPRDVQERLSPWVSQGAITAENISDLRAVAESQPGLVERGVEALRRRLRGGTAGDAAVTPPPLPGAAGGAETAAQMPPRRLEEFARVGNDRYVVYTTPEGDQANIQLVIGDDGAAEISVGPSSRQPNRFGPATIRDAARELRSLYPEIRTLHGVRESGAGPGRTQRVDLTSLLHDEPAERSRDIIDVRNLPPIPPGFTLEDPLGRVHPLGQQPTPVDMADVARGIGPAMCCRSRTTGCKAWRKRSAPIRARSRRCRFPSPRPSLRWGRTGTPIPASPSASGVRSMPKPSCERAAASTIARANCGTWGSRTPPAKRCEARTGSGRSFQLRGMTVDDAGELLWSHGYLHERPTRPTCWK
jgi:hypothetical protein